ncbi:MAG TPA: hypothetical protein VIQ31_02825 [Phormidium sp.]
MSLALTIAGTGHRPDKLGGYSDVILDRLTALAYAYLVRVDATHVISGMALGWDTAVCVAALRLGLPVTAAIPFKGQELKWPYKSQQLYHSLLTQCSSSIVLSSYQRRNEWMVQQCDRLVALWDGSSGGTANCIRYANAINRPYDNVWKSWEKFK